MSEADSVSPAEMSRGLTKKDIVELIDRALAALRLNRRLVTDEILTKMRGLVEDARGMADVIGRVLGLTPEQVLLLFEAAENFLDLEHRLVKTDFGPRLERTLEGMKGRPLILNLMAAIL